MSCPSHHPVPRTYAASMPKGDGKSVLKVPMSALGKTMEDFEFSLDYGFSALDGRMEK